MRARHPKTKTQTLLPLTLKQTHITLFELQSTKSMNRLIHLRRKRLASKLNNPRLLKIGFHTFRHWHATMLYNRTKDILLVKERLDHRSINNTLIYTQLVSFESDDYHSATAKTVEEACKLVEVGFEYVCEFSDIKIFRKRK